MRKYSPASFTAVRLAGAFWRERLDTVLSRTIPSQYRKLEEHGILDSLDVHRPAPPFRIPRNAHGFTTQIFWDSDIGKWIEAASYALHHRRDPEIERQIDDIVEKLAAAQAPDGYLNCWYLAREPQNRWTNLRDNHELYNAGHLLEGAIAYFRATGRRRFLDVMERYVDHIAQTFGPGEGQKRGYPGHPEIELALVKLYQLTGDRRRLDLAAYFVNERGQEPHYFKEEAIARGEAPEAYVLRTPVYNLSHKPVREQDKVVGHAVRAMYLYTAMADLAADLGDDGLKRACEVLWRDVTETRMYVTGGLGPSSKNEGFTTDYDLPNDTAYAETCAAVALIFWAQRMLNLDLDGRYADTLELALYNGALVGLSRDGETYFYDNPLESNGSHQRWEWHPCPCCTMNVSRLIASVAGYFYSTSEDEVAVHLYGGTDAILDVGSRKVRLVERSDYPWAGAVAINLDPEEPFEFALKLRIPGWAKGATARVNGKAVDVGSSTTRGYLEIRKVWQKGDAVELDLPMAAERMFAHPDVRADVGRVALARGPLVYCAEQIDNPAKPSLLRLPAAADVRAERRDGLLGGVVVLITDGERVEAADWQHDLYRRMRPQTRPARLTLMPYYLWNNRGPNPMQVWLAEK